MNKITTIEIENSVATYFGYRKNIIVPNISWGVGLHECDLLIIRKTGYGIEVEIKVSKSDLKQDLKKEHKHNDSRISELYFAIPNYLEDCIDFIPLHAGIIICTKYEHDVYCKMLRYPQKNKNKIKFTEPEMLKIAWLGTMRIWNLKRIIIGKRINKMKKKINKDQLSLVL